MKAILTKYHGPTATLPARLSAEDADDNRIMISRHDVPDPDPKSKASDEEQMHRYAAYQLCSKMNWGGELVSGAIRQGYVHCFASFHDPRDKK